jgi:Ni,Fe-hydrogenase III large subunit/Ni,Fe-hydrogenase III component G
MHDIRTAVENICQGRATELPRANSAELHFVIPDGAALAELCQWAAQQEYYFCTMVANDERFLEDRTFKLYYVLSAPQQQLIILEHAFSDLAQYVSIRACFASVEPLEREIADLFGILPRDTPIERQSILHAAYPADLYPLRPRRPLDKLNAKIDRSVAAAPTEVDLLPEGMVTQVVGPIHAAVIEAGQFRFDGAGELVEQISVRHGYKHRGIEKLFESQYTLDQGWQLAERVAGDTSFAHALAYCHAIEALAAIEPPTLATLWRGLLLELERVHNHIGTVAMLIHDIVLDLIASEMAVLRERCMRLNLRLGGHRLLHAINRVGGVVLPTLIDLRDTRAEIRIISTEFLKLGTMVLRKQSCRDRLMDVGVLTQREARSAGATGLMARASGLRDHDIRLRHPSGVYALLPELASDIRATVVPNDTHSSNSGRRVPIFERDLRGDIFARLALRLAEVETSTIIIERLITQLQEFAPGQARLVAAEDVADALRQAPNFEFSLGYAESWRGDIFYWVMKGPGNTIRRCKVRDPSLFNWHAFPLAVIPSTNPDGTHSEENILPDFPLINRSCDLSYAGYDG